MELPHQDRGELGGRPVSISDTALKHLSQRLGARELELALAHGVITERDEQLAAAREELDALRTLGEELTKQVADQGKGKRGRSRMKADG